MASKLPKFALTTTSASIFQHFDQVANRIFPRRLLITRKYAVGSDKATKRKELLAEFKKGYFADIKEYQKTGGKRFMAPTSIIEKEKAVKFPTFVATSLSGNRVDLAKMFQGHVTLMLIAMRGIAQPMCDAYREPFCEAFRDNKSARYFEVNAIDSLFYGIFKSFINKTLRKQIPEERHDNYLCYYGSTRGFQSDGLVENIIVGHAFLVDSNGLVRWRSCAKPTPEELDSLVNCCKRLLS